MNKKKKQSQLPQRGTEIFEKAGLPDFTESRIILCGNKHLFLENHRAVLEYSPQKLKICTKCHLIVIEGAELMIQSFSGENIMIDGTIYDLHFQPLEEEK